MAGVAKAVYDSAWQHPGMAWIAGAPLLLIGVVALRRPDRRPWAICFLVLQATVLVDAWLTGALSPLPAGGGAATVAAVVFVILGDLRYFYLVERQRAPRGPALARALPVSLVVPVATAVLTRLDARFSGNALYLAYELGLLVVVVVHARLRGPGATDGRRRYLRRLLALEGAQYSLWILADLLIVLAVAPSLVEVGWWLRILPNALYYVAFAPLATWAPPADARP